MGPPANISIGVLIVSSLAMGFCIVGRHKQIGMDRTKPKKERFLEIGHQQMVLLILAIWINQLNRPSKRIAVASPLIMLVLIL